MSLQRCATCGQEFERNFGDPSSSFNCPTCVQRHAQTIRSSLPSGSDTLSPAAFPVTIALIGASVLVFVVMVTTILSLRLFDQVYIMTRGGPLNATTTVMYQAVTSAFNQGNIGRAAAITVVFFVLVLGVALIQRWFLREEREIA